MLCVFYAVLTLALVCMLVSVIWVVRLYRLTRGGTIGRVVTIMAGLICFFTAGYAAAFFVPYLPATFAMMLTAFVFLFGAIFVLIVLSLIGKTIRRAFEQLQIDQDQ
ncbi:MAG TPA: hypothetical protein VM425_01650 [Myxococcota bacterium]|nr:hypothetical protein [Myxococcota bacterium]